MPTLSVGDIDLAPAQAHHLRDVLRMRAGDAVTAFDDHGLTGLAVVLCATPQRVTLRVSAAEADRRAKLAWTVAAAIPKGSRADWMIEKLAELGTGAFIPLSADRSVSLPAGNEKLARWSRLATEASRQSGRSGVMRIDPITSVAQVVQTQQSGERWYLSTRPGAKPVIEMTSAPPPDALLMLIGPEGGWTDEETSLLDASGFTPVRLAETILRVETAAIAAAAMAAGWRHISLNSVPTNRLVE